MMFISECRAPSAARVNTLHTVFIPGQPQDYHLQFLTTAETHFTKTPIIFSL